MSVFPRCCRNGTDSSIRCAGHGTSCYATGHRKIETFLCDDDYGVYLGLMKTWCDRHRVRIQAHCLMPNHVHLIAVPETLDGLSRAIGEAHRRYTRHVNFREGLNRD